MNIDIQFQVDDMQRELTKAEYKYLPASVKLSINRTVTTVKTEGKRKLFEALNGALTSRQILGSKGKDRGYLRHRMVSKATTDVDRMYGRVFAFGGRVSLIDMGAKQKGKIGRRPAKTRRGFGGTSYRSPRGAGRNTIQSAFIQTMKSGHKGVFKVAQDRAASAEGVKKGRLPIVELFGPSLPKVWHSHKIPTFLKKKAEEQFPKIFEADMRNRLKKAGWRV